MDYDDMQDKKQAEFDLVRESLLGGNEFSAPQKTTRGFDWFNIDDLLMKMYLEDVSTYRSKMNFATACTMIARRLAYIDELLTVDDEESILEIEKIQNITFGDCLIKAFRKDSDFVDEAVTHIMEGTAVRFFE